MIETLNQTHSELPEQYLKYLNNRNRQRQAKKKTKNKSEDLKHCLRVETSQDCQNKTPSN